MLRTQNLPGKDYRQASKVPAGYTHISNTRKKKAAVSKTSTRPTKRGKRNYGQTA